MPCGLALLIPSGEVVENEKAGQDGDLLILQSLLQSALTDLNGIRTFSKFRGIEVRQWMPTLLTY